MDGTTLLTVRVAADVPARMATIAGQRGEPVEQLVDQLLHRFLADAERQPPHIDDIVRRLRPLEPKVRDRHVAAMWVFGSVARGDATRDSDVDVMVEYEPGSRFSLLDVVHLKDLFERELDRPVDVLTRDALKPLIARAADAERVRVF